MGLSYVFISDNGALDATQVTTINIYGSMGVKLHDLPLFLALLIMRSQKNEEKVIDYH